EVVVYSAEGTDELERCLERARRADLVVKASGVGVFDAELEQRVIDLRRPGQLVALWDVDAPATLERVHATAADPFRALIPAYDVVFTYGGGEPVVRPHAGLGAIQCVPIFIAFDPTTHHPAAADPRFAGALGLLGSRSPDREARVERCFFEAARRLPGPRCLLGGGGWGDKHLPDHVHYLGHVYTHEHNAFNGTLEAVLNISRD